MFFGDAGGVLQFDASLDAQGRWAALLGHVDQAAGILFTPFRHLDVVMDPDTGDDHLAVDFLDVSFDIRRQLVRIGWNSSCFQGAAQGAG